MGYQEALEGYIAATNTHDFDEVSKWVSADAVYWFTDTSCTTKEDIRSYFEQAWDMVKEEVYTAEDLSWIAVSETQAVCIYTYHWEGIYQGKPASGNGRATNVFATGPDGEWKLIHEHLSAGEKR
ncbi:nuclear transport factor 2 family protein [Paenibacillus sp. CC-CFT742]|uniref:YybH family protein n=1 Tax=Paenibacillus illinoisensis TaxID=59845 RepID=UPI00203E3B75|nr:MULTISPECIES: nuclear transport factor 2 family protein [Paenibacillus]MCM3205688.1 nuclear transport factor 2 family protein [Paenibacillus illinoisensis]WJH30491.1 nuclear transport factor 2 family protein [Paenibacillus sp. CC-CFT742]